MALARSPGFPVFRLDPAATSIGSSFARCRPRVAAMHSPERILMLRSLVSRIALATLAGAMIASVQPASPLAASRNLLPNPGMEEPLPDHPWMPAGWDTSVSGLPTTFFGRDTFLVHGGRYAVSVATVSTLLAMAHYWRTSHQFGRA